MSKKKIDTSKLETGLTKLVGFAVKYSGNDIDDKLVDRLTDNLQKVKANIAENPEPDAKEVVDAIGEVLDFVTDLIPGDWDDMTIDTLYKLSRGAWEKKFADRINKA